MNHYHAEKTPEEKVDSVSSGVCFFSLRHKTFNRNLKIVENLFKDILRYHSADHTDIDISFEFKFCSKTV